MRLHELLPKLTAEQRNVLAEKCGTSVNYLFSGHDTAKTKPTHKAA